MTIHFQTNPLPLSETAVIASIQPQWSYKIFTREKGCEIRKTHPKIKPPFRVLVYSTKPKPRCKGLRIDQYEGEKHLLRVFRRNYALAESMGNTMLDGKIIGEFTCGRIDEFQVFENGSIQNWNYAGLDTSCVPYEDVVAYVGAGRKGYAWQIAKPVVYETPVPLSEAQKAFGLDVPITRAPMSWMYARPKGR